jgi:photosystem II stability/assembly factor-like uncharacterized protein
VLKKLFAACAASAVLSFAASSWANGRFPAADQLVFSPSDPNYVVLRATFAVLPSFDNGLNWHYICEDVLGLPNDIGEDPSIALSANGSIIAGVAGYVGGGLGISVSADKGCNWNCVGGGLMGQSVVDIAVRPDNPASAVALTGTFLPSDAGVVNSYTQVFETTDDGQTWAAIGKTLDPTVVVETIDVTKSDPNRIYISGTRAIGSTRTASLFVSLDKGQTWAESPIPQFDSGTETGVYIAAIDPNDANRVYLRSSGNLTGGQSRIFYTSGGGTAGATFALPSMLPDNGGFDTDEAGAAYVTGEILGFAISPDGSSVYAGTIESGLWMASKSDMVFKQVNANVHVRCLQTRSTAQGDELWACSDVASGFIVGVSTDNGTSFNSKMKTVTNVCGPIECAPSDGGPLGCGATTNASDCASTMMDSYQNFCALNDSEGLCGVCVADDAGAAPDGAAPPSDAGTAPVADAGTASTSNDSGCSCSNVSSRGGATGLAAGLGFLGITLLRRRERRR